MIIVDVLLNLLAFALQGVRWWIFLLVFAAIYVLTSIYFG